MLIGDYTRQLITHPIPSMAFAFKILTSVLALLTTLPLQAQLDNLASGSSSSLLTSGLLRVEQAFVPQGLASASEVEIIWRIEPGYYLYRKQFRVFVEGEEVSAVEFDQGEVAYDPFFDEELEIYRDETRIAFPMATAGRFEVRFQGCADAGYCYPPSWAAFETTADNASVNYLGLVAGPGQTPDAQTMEPRQIWLWIAATLGSTLVISLACWQFYRGQNSKSRSF